MLAETAETTAQSHVGSLPRQVQATLAQAGLDWPGVDGLAISIGPGSLTGLRIGLSLVKGIAYAGRLPVAAVPTLEALAHVADATPGETVCAALDARKREVYAALFVAGDGAPRRLTPDLAVSPEALAAQLTPPCVLVGDAGEVYRDALAPRATLRPFATHHPRGGVVARLGSARLAAGERANIGTLEPTYVRPPDAELPRPR